MFWLWFILITPGVIVFYALVVRGILHKNPTLKCFYDNADTFWAKVWALCGNSLTVAWSYIVGGIGLLLELLDPISTALGDPDLKMQITDALQTNPKVLSYILMGISAITIGVRVRGINRDT